MAADSDRPAASMELLELAVHLAHRAGELSAERFLAGERIFYKTDGTEATSADLAVEEMIRTTLEHETPQDGFVGEETGERLGSSGNRWVVDPIDGTFFFANRVPAFCNHIAYEDQYGCALGVISMPMQQEVVFAGRGLGCFVLRGRECQLASSTGTSVSTHRDLPGATATIWNVGLEQWSEQLLVALHRHLRLLPMGASGVAMLATGRIDAVVMPEICERHDWAPFPVLIEEAGGRLTDFAGAPLPGEGSGLATNGALHDPFLEILAALPRTRNGAGSSWSPEGPAHGPLPTDSSEGNGQGGEAPSAI